MIANVAFLAAITTFLAVAWLAGELSFLAPLQGRDLSASRDDDRAVGRRAVPQSVCRVLRHRTVAVSPRYGRKLSHMDRQLGSKDAVLRDLHRDLKV